MQPSLILSGRQLNDGMGAYVANQMIENDQEQYRHDNSQL